MVNRPWVLVNSAMSVDGKIDGIARQGASISSPADMARMDRLRMEADAVMVGGHTLLAGDPRLTIKSPELREERKALGLPENPAKVAVVTEASLSPESRFITAGPARRFIFTTTRTAPEQIARLEAAGAEVFIAGQVRVDLANMMAALAEKGIRRLMVEGGGTLIAELFRLKFVDELKIYVAPWIFGGAAAPSLVDGPGFLPGETPRLILVSAETFDADGGILIHYTVRPDSRPSKNARWES